MGVRPLPVGDWPRRLLIPIPPGDGVMTRHKLHVEALTVESFDTITDPTDVRGTVKPNPGGCICFAPPCICSNGPDCAATTP